MDICYWPNGPKATNRKLLADPTSTPKKTGKRLDANQEGMPRKQRFVVSFKK
jgi:hypothetical protein